MLNMFIRFFCGPERESISKKLDSKSLFALRILGIGIMTTFIGYGVVAGGYKLGGSIAIGGFVIAFIGLVFHFLLAARNLFKNR